MSDTAIVVHEHMQQTKNADRPRLRHTHLVSAFRDANAWRSIVVAHMIADLYDQ